LRPIAEVPRAVRITLMASATGVPNAHSTHAAIAP
jgi:hypothetical protein